MSCSDVSRSQETDAELSARFERDALPLLDALFNGALRLTHNRRDAEDLVIDAMVSAYAHFRSFRADGMPMKAWLFRRLFGTWRATPRRRDRTGPVVAQEVLTGAGVAAVLYALPEQPRMAVYLVDVEGFSYQDTAGILNVPVDVAVTLLRHGRAQLRKGLSSHGQMSGADGLKYPLVSAGDHHLTG